MSTTWTTATAPKALPLIGHALQLRNGLLAYLASLPPHGDMVRIQIGPWKGYAVCHPDLVNQLFLDDRTFDKGGPVYDKGREVMGNGLGVCPHQDHRRQRRLIQPAFNRDRMPQYTQIVADEITTIMDAWHDGQVIDVHANTHALTAQVLAKILFAADTDGQAGKTTVENVADIMRGAYRHMIMPLRLLNTLPTPGNRRFHHAIARVRTAVDRTIENYRRDGIDHADLLSMLLAARDEADQPLSTTEINDQIVTFLMAAIEAPSVALSWALYLVARHPEVQQRLRAEVDTVLGGRTAGWDDLPRLELTGRIITETLRLYPSVWMATRTVAADTELAGHRLPAGTTLLFSTHAIHHRADIYPDPERFDPDRWEPGQIAHLAHRSAYIPFGGGARKCLGDNFAMAETTLALASIAARWNLQLTTDAPPRPVPRVVLAPRPLRLRLHRRTDLPIHRG